MTKGQKFGNRVRELRNTHKPGRNPGTSTNVMMGMLNASQKRTNRAPLTEALMSKQPEIDQQIKSKQDNNNNNNNNKLFEPYSMV